MRRRVWVGESGRGRKYRYVLFGVVCGPRRGFNPPRNRCTLLLLGVQKLFYSSVVFIYRREGTPQYSDAVVRSSQ